jgi:HSP20 family protein
MDFEQMKKWQEMARKFQNGNFWSEVFENPYARRFMDGVGESFWDEPAGKQEQQLYPCCDIFEGSTDYFVVVELPGVQKSDIQLAVSGDNLTIRGDVKPLHINCTALGQERYCGSFERTVRLPQAITRDRMSARFANGLLEIRIPRSHQAAEHKIHID